MPRYCLNCLPPCEDELARALVGAGEQRAEHDGVGAGDERLGDVARVLQAAVGDDRDAGLARRERRLVDRGHLRHADAGDDARGADRARADADLDGIHARVDERLRALAGRDVAADDVDVGERRVGLEAADDVDDARRTAPLAVSTTRTSTPASRSASARSHASPKKPIAAPTRRRPCSSLVASGYFSLLSKSLTVMRPASLPSSSTSGSFSTCACAKIAIDVVRRRCRPAR